MATKTADKKPATVIAVETGEFTTIHKETRFNACERDEYELVINNPAKVVEFSDTTIDDMVAKARAEGQAEAWELARKIVIPHEHGGYSYTELTNIFGVGDIVNVIEKLPSFAEAQAKVVADEKKFRPGDIVVNKYGTRAIVTCTNGKSLYVLYSDGSGGDQNSKHTWSGKFPDLQWKKTGKHIDLDEFFEAIKGKKEPGNE